MGKFSKIRRENEIFRKANVAIMKLGLKCLEDAEDSSQKERSYMVDEMNHLLDVNARSEEQNCKLEREMGRCEGICIGGMVSIVGIIIGNFIASLIKK